MTYNEVIGLGWKDRHPESKNNLMKDFVYEAEGFDYHIISVCFNQQEDDGVFELVMINCVPEKTNCNVWGDSETHFYGQIKTPQELDLIMQFLGIKKYKGIENGL